MRSRQAAWNVPAEQLPWVMTGKWYLLVRLIFQVTVCVWWLVMWSRGEAGVGPATWAGLGLLAVGYSLRRWARAVLGERFRSFEVRREERGLERGGPYRALRHPGYVGLAMMDAGLPLALNQPYLLPLSLAPIALLVRRARLETGLLRKAYP